MQGRLLCRLALGLVAAVALAACERADAGWGGSSQAVRGSGTTATEARAVAGFTAIDVSGSMTLEVAVGPATKVEVTADDNLVPLIRTEVEGDTLVISTRASFSTRSPVIVRVATPTLAALVTRGSGDATVTGVRGDRLALTSTGSGAVDAGAEVAHLTARVSGSGALRLRGRADDLRVELSGSGAVAAREAPSATARVTVTGSGSAELTVRDGLDATVTGSGSIDYWGSPGKVEHRVTGSGAVRGH